jgi:hypothetical protein
VLDTSGVLRQVSSAQVSIVQWLNRVDDSTIPEVHRVVSAVVELGGAVGWLQVPIPEADRSLARRARQGTMAHRPSPKEVTRTLFVDDA